MAFTWTTPADQITGHIVTATDWNATGQDDLSFLYGDTGWTNVSGFGTNWSAGSPTPRFILHGRLVIMQGIVSGAVGATLDSTMFTLPAGYRPSANVHLATCSGTGGSVFGLLQVNSTGVVVLHEGTPASSSVSIGVTFSVA